MQRTGSVLGKDFATLNDLLAGFLLFPGGVRSSEGARFSEEDKSSGGLAEVNPLSKTQPAFKTRNLRLNAIFNTRGSACQPVSMAPTSSLKTRAKAGL